MRQLLRGGFHRRVLLPFLAAVTLVLAAFVIAEARRGHTRDQSELIRERHERMSMLAELIYACIEAESAQRGYLLTGERQYAGPYDEARATALQLTDDLNRRYAETESAETIVLAAVHDRIRSKIAEMDTSIAMMQEGRNRDALAAVKTDIGLHHMTEIRAELEALRTRERTRIYQDLMEWNIEIRNNGLINLATTLFTLVLLILVALLATRELRRRQAAQQELEGLVKRRTAALQDLSTHMLRMSEREKSALARELHDELGGLLVALRMDLAQLRRRIALPDDDAKQRWARVDAALTSGVELKRRVIEELRPTLLDNMGLVAALRWQAEQSCALGRIALETDLPDDEPSLDSEAGIAIFRVVQEALANVLKHSRATRVKVAMRQQDHELCVTVEDDGIGLPDGAEQRPGAHGLKQMNFRMQAVSGELAMTPVQPHGTRLTLRVRC